MEKQSLGKKIASRRKAAGMTQAELAEKMGVTDKAVSKWERDLSCPDVGSLPKLAELFGISVDELIQVRPAVPQEDRLTRLRDTVTLVCKAVSLAMGVAVTVLSLLKAIDPTTAVIMLGIGSTCAGIVALQNKKQ